jgi:hypothetical protein
MLGCLLNKFFEKPFHQVLPLDHQVPKIVLLGPCHLPLQCRQVVSQEIPEEDCVIVRKD